MNVASLEAHRVSKQYEQHYKKCANLEWSLDTVHNHKKKPITTRDYEKAFMKLLSNQIK